MKIKSNLTIFVLTFFVAVNISFAQKKDNLRARDLGIPFNGTPGRLNAITDVPGVEVGYKTLIDGSGDIFLALSTITPLADNKNSLERWNVIQKGELNPVFEATVEATEEAIINALVAAQDMEGINGNKCFALPLPRLKEIMRKYNRLNF